ncbi:MAG TPA: suppressor of fused domain protein, partial [Mycobacteriales bacterium]
VTLVEAHLLAVLGGDSGRASVSFVGADRIDVVRFGPDADGFVRYVTLGMSRAPMSDPAELVAAEEGPRAELLLTVRGAHDTVLRRLAILAATPAVEGLVVTPGARIELGEPLWDGGAMTAVLIGEPGGFVPSLDDPAVDLLPVLPMTPNEAAYVRVHGGAALEERWLAQGIDVRDPARAAADLT